MSEPIKERKNDAPGGGGRNVGAAKESLAWPDELASLKAYLETQGRPLAYSVLVVLAMVLGILFFRARKQGRIEDASIALATARDLQDVEAVTTRYEKTPSAPLAVLRAAKMYYDAGNFNMAIAKYDEFLAKFPDHLMASSAVLGKIFCKEAKGQREMLEEALAEFTSFAESRPEHYLVSQAVFGRARCLDQLGRREEAKAVYEDFIVRYPDSRWKTKAEDLLKLVEKKIERSTRPRPAVGETPSRTYPMPMGPDAARSANVMGPPAPPHLIEIPRE